MRTPLSISNPPTPTKKQIHQSPIKYKLHLLSNDAYYTALKLCNQDNQIGSDTTTCTNQNLHHQTHNHSLCLAQLSCLWLMFLKHLRILPCACPCCGNPRHVFDHPNALNNEWRAIAIEVDKYFCAKVVVYIEKNWYMLGMCI